MDMAAEITDLKRRQAVCEHCISNLESELKDTRQLTSAMVQVNEKVDYLKNDMEEIKCDVKTLNARPGQLWDKIATAALGAMVAGVIAAILSITLKL